VEFRLLGPLEVVEHERSLSLGGVKQRSLLAILLLHPNQLVPAEQLMAELWGDAAPATAAKSVQVYVSRLRKQLGPARLATRAPGYVLRLDPAELDLARFERLRAEASRADAETAGNRLREALGLWRGPALGDLSYEPCVQAHIARLEELRQSALDARIDADLATGHHADLIGELEALITAHPLRERLRCQLMLALYRAGRQAEALEVYRAARRDLAEELGLEPGEDLKRLERAILEQDPALELVPQKAKAARRTVPIDRSLLIVPRAPPRLDALLPLAAPLAASDPPRELIVACVVAPAEVGAATAALTARADELRSDGVAIRTVAFSSPTPSDDVVRLATRERVDLLLMEAERSPLEGGAATILEHAPCDVALLIQAGGSLRFGPVVVPFGAARHDWAALELGAWIARATDSPLRLIGATGEQRHDGRDGSRLLADASLIIQRRLGVIAEPLLASPGHSGVVALAGGAGLLVVGLSDRWEQEGLGRLRTALADAPPAPTVLVRRGHAPDRLAPEETSTRFNWSLTAGAR
jgi:DNA-binding SARP family transcriptional activator